MTERFELLELIGKGGMGAVWKARDSESGEIVAIKLLHQHLADETDYVARFEREVEVTRTINSPNVVRTTGYGTRDGVPYMVMELVEGPSLRQTLTEQGSMSWEVARPIMAGVLRGLRDAHARNVLHRDVKPANILLPPSGQPKLADFGIARASDLTRLTGTATTLGTPAYMAPEAEPSVQADLYAAGCVLYEMLTGAPPFSGNTMQRVLLSHIREQPDLTRVPLTATPILTWLLAKDPAARPPTAAAALEALDGTRTPPTPLTAEPGPVAVAPSAVRHRRRWPVIGAASMCSVLVLSGIVWTASRTDPEPTISMASLSRHVVLDGGSYYDLGPIVRYGGTTEISFSFTAKCQPGKSSLGWMRDFPSQEIRLVSDDGRVAPLSAASGIATTDASMQCDESRDGSWAFDTGDHDGPWSFVYNEPKVSFSLPDAEVFVLVREPEWTVSVRRRVTGSTCASIRSAPAAASREVACVFPGPSATVTFLSAGAVMNHGEWVRVEQPARGWMRAESLGGVP